MRWRRTVGCALAIVTVAVAASCRTPTEITLVLSSDLPCSALQGTQITIGNIGEIETKDPTTTAGCTGNGDIGSLVILPNGSDTDEVAIKVLTGYTRKVEDCAQSFGLGCIVARRAVRFLPHTSLRINVVMRVSCNGVPCTYATTCASAGACASAFIPDNSKCTGGGCGENVLPPIDGGVDDSGADAADAADAGDGADAPAAAVTKIATGDTHTCALLSTGAMRCWGRNAGGLGNGVATGDAQTTPADVQQLGFAPTDVTAGTDVTCALAAAPPRVRCWGDNMTGQLGGGNPDVRLLPGDLPQPDGGTYTQISQSCAKHACAVVTGGRVQCWGANGAGQLGDNTEYDRAFAADVVRLNQPVQFVTTARGFERPTNPNTGSARSFTCALLKLGAVQCWGANAFNEITQGGTEDTIPTDVVGLTGAAAQSLSAGGRHACVVLNTGGVRCWGDDTMAQIGDGTVNTLSAPTDVTGLNDFVAVEVAAGDAHTCARSNTGAVRCWGDNSFRQIGDNDGTSPRLAPTDVPLGGSARAISAGSNHTCAIMADGRVRCWGRNDLGQLGDGTVATPAAPVTVTNLP